MQRNVYGVLSFLVLAMVLAGPVLEAQSRVTADVPFAFSLGDKSMAAGRYAVESRSEQLAVIRNLQTEVAHYLIKSVHVQARRTEPAMLVFNRYGNDYFLSQIWDGNSDTGIQLGKSRREKEVSLARNGSSGRPDIIVLAMK
jgi:hypothetical protein